MNKKLICRKLAKAFKWPIGKNFDDGEEILWQPFDPFDAESDSAWLLEAMSPVSLKTMYNSRSEIVWDCYIATTGQFAIDPDRKTAIALAACLWKGVEA